jgi:uncharacterized membrane protein YgcG
MSRIKPQLEPKAKPALVSKPKSGPKPDATPRPKLLSRLLATKQNRLLLILIAMVLLAIAITAGVMIRNHLVEQQRLYDEASNSYTTLVSETNPVKDDLDIKLEEARTLLDNTSADSVTDATILEELKAIIEASEQLNTNIPELAATTDEINSQLDQLTTTRADLEATIQHLTEAIDKVTRSKEDKATQLAEEEKKRQEEEAKQQQSTSSSSSSSSSSSTKKKATGSSGSSSGSSSNSGSQGGIIVSFNIRLNDSSGHCTNSTTSLKVYSSTTVQLGSTPAIPSGFNPSSKPLYYLHRTYGQNYSTYKPYSSGTPITSDILYPGSGYFDIVIFDCNA